MKVARTRRYGAEIVTYNRDTDDRDAIAQSLCAERNAAFIPPFDHRDVIAGQGTVGLELMEQASAINAMPDAVLAPCSGGGLISGVALAVKQAHPAAEVYSVEPEGFDDLARSLASGHRERNERMSGSICDALLAPSPGELPLAICRETLAGGVAVSDDEVTPYGSRSRSSARRRAGRRRSPGSRSFGKVPPSAERSPASSLAATSTVCRAYRCLDPRIGDRAT